MKNSFVHSNSSDTVSKGACSLISFKSLQMVSVSALQWKEKMSSCLYFMCYYRNSITSHSCMPSLQVFSMFSQCLSEEYLWDLWWEFEKVRFVLSQHHHPYRDHCVLTCCLYSTPYFVPFEILIKIYRQEKNMKVSVIILILTFFYVLQTWETIWFI